MPEDFTDSRVDQLLAAMLRTTGEYAVVLTDVEGHIRWSNATSRRILGYDAQNLLGQLIDISFTPQDVAAGVPDQERKIALGLGQAADDRWHQRADGSKFWTSGLLTALRDEDGSVRALCKVFRNRTDVQEQLTQFENALRKAEHTGERQMQSLATVAHELRSPLSALFNTAAVLKHQLGAQPGARTPLEILDRQLGAIRKQVDDLLDMARITTGKVHLDLAPTRIQQIIMDAAETVLPTAEQRARRLRLVLGEEAIIVMGDETRLRQVFINLLSNAVKFTPVEGEISVSLARVDREAVAVVKDSGIGIPTELLPRIFDLFTQADGAAVQQGLGIGLALVRELVSLHGGSIQVRSDGPGKGSEFTVRLPLAS
jgi:PAS domain S-box-containing protein